MFAKIECECEDYQDRRYPWQRADDEFAAHAVGSEERFLEAAASICGRDMRDALS